MKKNLKYKFLSAIIIGIILLPICTNFIILKALAQENSFQNISVQEAYSMIKKEKKTENLVILDVRENFKRKHFNPDSGTSIWCGSAFNVQIRQEERFQTFCIDSNLSCIQHSYYLSNRWLLLVL
ncbi:MAG: hypothetical protein HWN81_11540 [Candidatus Lokiarchaeota archaeon]|nr:hypothetical protein [Candidatus Lokiarchaeota archaeon]